MKTMSPELAAWLRNRTDDSVTVKKLHGDVSGRLFWRVFSGDGTLILMDSGKIPVWPWIDIHELLTANGFRVPSIMEIDTRRGWVLHEDLGNCRLLDVDDTLYMKLLDEAVDIIIALQRRLDSRTCADSIAGRRSFTPAFFMAELENTLETLFFRLLKVPMDDLLELQKDMRRLCGSIDGSSVFVHRDFHSSNLMVVKDRLVMVDWQDARFGPPAYDAVSLLRDSYRDPGQTWEDKAKRFLISKGNMNMFQIARTACQRSLKAIGTFGFHYRKTGDTSYLGFIPRTFRYLADYARICPQLDDLVRRTYRLLDSHHGEIDLRDFRSANIPGVRGK
ncbi:MAG: phosphotransferase [Candidatus Fermentibacteraceae bacterium]|nr:phosphotransferase [Candidatus Fermentibacteraceae bacterium]MBN2609072.1 phosphotransferase [Candidatus Fermentibacteraceae bacterium]